MTKQTDNTNQINEEEPLDPAVEHIRRRMLRLQMVSLGIIFVSLFAVFAAIIFKSNASSALSENPLFGKIAESAEIDLPNGAQILETQIDGQTILLHLDIEGQPHIWIVDLETMQTMSRIKLRN